MHAMVLKRIHLTFFLVGLASISQLSAEKTLDTLCPLYDSNVESSIGLYPFEDSEGNKLETGPSYDVVQYYRLRCGGRPREILAEFQGQPKSSPIPPGHFRVLGKRHFGKGVYWEIQLGKRVESSGLSKVSQKNDQPDKTKRYNNPNLFFFQSIARDKTRRKEAPSQIEVFFDHSCPLVFQAKDNQFYWDAMTSYRFEVSCVRDSNLGTIRIPADKNGNLIASNTVVKNIQPGDKFLLKATLAKLTDEHAFWESFTLYYE